MSLLGVVTLAKFAHAQTLAAPQASLSTQLCDRIGSGAVLISNSQYDKNSSKFEFKIDPSTSKGAVTVIGLANDGISRESPFLDIVFDA